MSRRSAALLAAAALYALLAVLVAAGVFDRFDQWAVDTVMPGADFHNEETSLTADLVPLLDVNWSNGWHVAVNIVTLPASFLVSLALVGWRSRPLAAALAACVAVEILCKELLVRPALHDGFMHIEGFDGSFPSGHSLRIVLLAIAFWPLLRGWVAAWALASLALLLLAGWHTPTDVAGGVLLGALGAGAAGALRARRLRAPAGA